MNANANAYVYDDPEEYRARYGQTRFDRASRLVEGNPYGDNLVPEHPVVRRERLRPPPPNNWYVFVRAGSNVARVISQKYREGNNRVYRVRKDLAMQLRVNRRGVPRQQQLRTCECPDSEVRRMCKHAHAVRLAVYCHEEYPDDMFPGVRFLP